MTPCLRDRFVSWKKAGKSIDIMFLKRWHILPERPGFCDENYNHSGVKLEISGEKTGVFGPKMPQSKLY
jgi:hypothetical protein